MSTRNADKLTHLILKYRSQADFISHTDNHLFEALAIKLLKIALKYPENNKRAELT